MEITLPTWPLLTRWIVSDALDKKNSTIGMFIDLSKAIDTVNHSI